MNGVMNNNSFKTIRYTQVNYAIYIYYPVVNSNLPKIVGNLPQMISMAITHNVLQIKK